MSAAPRRFYTLADQETLIAAYHAGQPLSAIATALGRTQSSVENQLRRLKVKQQIKRRPTGRPPKSIAYKDGLSPADLAWMAYWRLPRVVRWNRNLQAAALNTP